MKFAAVALLLCLALGSAKAANHVVSVDFAPFVVTVPSQWEMQSASTEGRFHATVFQPSSTGNKDGTGSLEFLSVVIRVASLDFKESITDSLKQIGVKDFVITDQVVSGFTRVEPVGSPNKRFCSAYYFKQDGVNLCMVELSTLVKRKAERTAAVEAMLSSVTSKISVNRRVAVNSTSTPANTPTR